MLVQSATFLVACAVATTAGASVRPVIVHDAPIIALTDVRVIDGTGAAPKINYTIIIREGSIAAMGPSDDIAIPETSKRIRLAGKSMLPGWVMMHEHLYYHMRPPPLQINDPDGANYWQRDIARIPQTFAYPALYLADGVTTGRTAGPEAPWAELKLKERIDSKQQIGPDLYLTLPKLRDARGPDDARRRVRFWASQGASSVKVHARLKKEEMAAAIDEAHKLGLKVTGHLGYVTYREAVDMGIDQIEHGFAGVAEDLCEDKEPGQFCQNYEAVLLSLMPEDERVQNIFRHIIDNEVIVTSTMAIQRRGELPGRYRVFFNESGLRDYEAFRKAYEADIGPIYYSISKKISELDAAFWRAGGILTVGGDASGTGNLAGFANLKSIELLVDAGIPSLEAIKIATHNGAMALGILNDRGTIEIGKRADLIIVNGDPSEDIRDIYKIETVFKAGIGYDSDAIKQRLIGTIGGPF